MDDDGDDSSRSSSSSSSGRDGSSGGSSSSDGSGRRTGAWYSLERELLRRQRDVVMPMWAELADRRRRRQQREDDGEDDFDSEQDDDDSGYSTSSSLLEDRDFRERFLGREDRLNVRRIRRLNADADADAEPEEEDSDDDDEAEYDDDGPWVVAIDSESIECAARDLRGARMEDEIEHMKVATYVPREEWSRRDVRKHPIYFHRFVTRLGEQGRVIRSIKFDNVDFVTRMEVYRSDEEGGEDTDEEGGEHSEGDDDSSRHRRHRRRDDNNIDTIRQADLEELLGSTLPRHPTLEKIVFESCCIPEAYFELFTSSLPSSHDRHIPLKDLTLDCGLGPGTRIRSIADMVRRNARVSRLAVSGGFHGLESDEFRLLCSGLESNTNLRTLTVRLANVGEYPLDGALAPNSPLEALHIKGGGNFSNSAAAASLAELLKTNEKLVELTLPGQIGRFRDEHRLDVIASVMETSNFTLQKFSEGRDRDGCHHHLMMDSRIGTCLRRNRWIHHVLKDWPNYRVPFQALWPTVLHRADSCPTLLYRFVRRGNLPAVCDAVVRVARGRGRSIVVETKQPRSTRKRKARDK
jgi:hypothetical protein